MGECSCLPACPATPCPLAHFRQDWAALSQTLQGPCLPWHACPKAYQAGVAGQGRIA